MTPSILACEAGGCEQVNADFADHWAVQGGHFYVVCDGIGHNENTAAAVSEFCELLRGELSVGIVGDEEAVENAIINAVRSLEQKRASFAFCLTAALKLKDRLIVAHCGDCRLGFLTPEGVDWQTKDDVPNHNLYRQGLLDRESYLKARHLVSCKIKPAFSRKSLKVYSLSNPDPQCMLLCSDGFWSYLEVDLEGTPVLSMEVIDRMLPELASCASDNFSVILV
ncbi:PP2C family protein-serine/threonine phosphatase [Shewanella algae]|uniref:PP2C family protein-serine/threonine phosphatase n=1 Tax=Shewanella algae TaxID=38313 RepID=UPI001AACC12B|nr:protein phosphatase 2C domain-containing protein [Shewanella algae]MBO2698751.1 protein phosphatase 2C domain-containing protein [Shewanella algae]